MELQEALTQISAIRRQMARSERFHGYRAAPVAISALLAFAAGAVQAALIPQPAQRIERYLALWIAVAMISLALCLGTVWLRNRRDAGRLHRETTRLALGQFFPCLVAGALLTLVVMMSTPHVAWTLPGLWAILFSMGLFASWRLLPPAIVGVAIYFLASGLWALALGGGLSSTSAGGQGALSPWTMPLEFGVGQLLTAIVLLLAERTGGEREHD